jgi:mRNA interferase HigB
MRIISRKTIRGFCERFPDAQKSLQAWYADTKQAHWNDPNDIKKVYKNVSIVANKRVVFNIKGNDYRLVVAINYKFSIIYVRFVGTHKEYGKIDVTEI